MTIYPDSREGCKCNAKLARQGEGRDPLSRRAVHAMQCSCSCMHFSIAPFPAQPPPRVPGRPACCPAIAASA
jgi:hypothetical protein